MRTDGPVYGIKSLLDRAAVPFFRMGLRPFSPGYETVKRRLIESAIDSGVLRDNGDLPPGYGVAMDERVVEYPWLFGRLNSVGRMLDAGSTFNHDFLLDRAPLKGADLTIMTLAPEKRCYWYRGYSYVYGDLRNTYFADATFDTIASISTIEHIGLDNTMLYTSSSAYAESDELGFLPAVKEFRRIIRPGGTCFISVPFGKRDNFGWYQVFDPGMIDAIVGAFQPSSCQIAYFGYSRSGWLRGDRASLSASTVYDVRTGKGWETDRAAASRAIACLQMVV